jgi:hypothetical protein
MERAGSHVMFYYYSGCLYLGKTKENFTIVGVIYLVLLIQGISRVIMQPTIHFRISEKAGYYSAFLEMAKHKQEII